MRRPPKRVRRGHYTRGQLAGLLGVSTSTVSTWIAQGLLTPDERGHIGNADLRKFYDQHAELLP